MRTSTKRIAGDDRGQDAAEYGIALAVVGAIALSAALAIGTQVGLIWNPVDSVVSVVHGHGNHGNGNGNGNGNAHGNGNGNS